MVDVWARWLRERRHGNDPEALRQTMAVLGPVRDRVLANARIRAGDTVVDVGCGDGLMGFGALEHVGEGGTVVFSDVSADLVGICRQQAEDMGVAERCRCVVAELPGLATLPDADADVVMTRSVLIYVKDKAAAFRALYRVLRPGGRLSLFEPVNRYLLASPPGERFGFDVSEAAEAAARLERVFVAGDPAADPMLDFDERDLLAHAEAAGFTELRLDLTVEAKVSAPLPTRDWAVYLRSSPNPTAPTFGDALASLGAADRAALERCLRPQVEAGVVRRRMATAYLSGVRPDGAGAG